MPIIIDATVLAATAKRLVFAMIEDFSESGDRYACSSRENADTCERARALVRVVTYARAVTTTLSSMATLRVLILLAIALEFGDCVEPVAQRVTDLLKQMTVDEKAGQLMHVYGGGSEKLKFVAGWGSFPGGGTPERMVKTRNEMQQMMMNQ